MSLESLKPLLLSYDCAAHDPIDSWVPPLDDDIDIWLTLNIGYDLHGGDHFKVHIVTPNHLKGAAKYTLVIHRYHFKTILHTLTTMIESCTGDDWPEVTQKLSKHFYWEYAESY
jgi:hypothetical protein